MKHIKRIIIFIIIIIIVLIALIVILKNRNLKENQEILNEVTTEETKSEENNQDKTVELVKNRNNFYTVKECVLNYLKYNFDKDYESLYALLDQSYIEENNINKDNISSKLNYYNEQQSLNISEMYKKEIDKQYVEYYIYAQLRDAYYSEDDEVTYSKEDKDFYITITLDIINNYYTVNIDENYCKKKINEFDKNTNIELSKADEEKKKEKSEEVKKFLYKQMSVSNTQMVYEYMKNYLYNVDYHIEKAYNLLDDEYKAEIGSLADYKKYVQENKDWIQDLDSMKYKDFSVNKEQDETVYSFNDYEGRKYTIKERAVMFYTINIERK